MMTTVWRDTLRRELIVAVTEGRHLIWCNDRRMLAGAQRQCRNRCSSCERGDLGLNRRQACAFGHQGFHMVETSQRASLFRRQLDRFDALGRAACGERMV